MDQFWRFARDMLKYRVLVILALVMAFLTGISLGTGIVGAEPVVSAFSEDSDLSLRGMMQEAAEGDGLASGIIQGLPEGFIEWLPERPFPSLRWILIALGIVAVVGGTCNFLHRYFALEVVNRSIADLRRRAFVHAIRLPLGEVVRGGATEPVHRVVVDSQALMIGYTALLSKAVAQITRGVAGLMAALIADWLLTVIALAVAPVLAWIIKVLGSRIKRASKAALEHREELYHSVNESMTGLRVVKAYTAERYEIGRFSKANKGVLRELLRVRTARALANPLTELTALMMLGVLAAIAAKAVMDGHLSGASFAPVLAGLAISGASFKPLTNIIADIQSSAAAADRMKTLFDSPVEAGFERGLPKLGRHERSIAFEDVVFTYTEADSPAIDGLSLEIPFGETVAFVGPNGSGKTTLLSLVPRFFAPDSGRVLVDGIDIASVGLKSLRRQIGVVTQETVLFRGSIRENITYGKVTASDDEIEAAARAARAWAFIERQPAGLSAEVGEQGLTLSGGQRQRIAIARAILRDPSILILDEATSMVDAESEQEIATALAEFGAGRTCLIVAHRLATVLNADRIVVLDQGRISDMGKHEELLDRSEVYRQIAHNQLAGTS
ncbi:MAG: ABC transporter ATP-binding protein [Planctomycetota bacterium]